MNRWRLDTQSPLESQAVVYRLVDCGTWDDPWFESLEPQGKLFFLYLLTNPRSTSCGAFEITPRKMAFETGLDQIDIERWLGEWSPRVQWWPEHQVVFLKNFFRRQTNSDKVRVNAMRLVKKLPLEVRRAICMVYPELQSPGDTLSIPYADPSDKQNRDVTETEQNGDETPPLPPKGEAEDDGYTAEFEAFWTAYPRVVNNSKIKAFKAFKKLTAAERRAARDALPRYVASDGWQRGFAPHTSTFLNGKLWQSEPPEAGARASPSNGYQPAAAARLAESEQLRDDIDFFKRRAGLTPERSRGRARDEPDRNDAALDVAFEPADSGP